MPKTKQPDNAKNLETEDSGLAYLQVHEKGIFIPNLEERRELLRIIGVSAKFIRTFDAIKLKVPSLDKVKNGADFELIEVKVTYKALPKFPSGFFFGMTENEEMLLKVLEPNFKLCLACICPEQTAHKLLTYTDLHKLIKNKRIQYQINL